MLTTTQIAALKTELNTDPRAYGYAADLASGNDAGLVAKLNLVRDGTNGGPAVSVKRPDVKPTEILEAIDIRDFLATPGGVTNNTFASGWFESITQFPTVRLSNADGTKTTVRKNIDRMVADVQGSQARLDAVAVRTGSRAEELFGFGATVTDTDIANAKK